VWKFTLRRVALPQRPPFAASNNGEFVLNTQLTELQNRVVLGVANSVGVKWDYLLVNFEREVVDNEPTEDCLAIMFTRDNGNWKRQSFQIHLQCYDLFLQLCEKMSKEEIGKWGSCTLELNSGGRFRFSFSYEPPKRLNGDLTDGALLKNYLPRPLDPVE
jgi:hypothetical protein